MGSKAVDFERVSSLVAMFYAQAERLGSKPFLWVKKDKQYRAMSWRDTAQAVTAAANGLIEAGLKIGDRVVLICENRPEWCIADLAIMAAGGITVPAYTTNTVADHLHILNDCEASAIIVSSGKMARNALSAAVQMRRPPFVVFIDGDSIRQNPGVNCHAWKDILAKGYGKPVPQHVTRAQRGHTACIIYTSGTGGVPKGVVTSHGAILCNCMGAHDIIRRLKLNDREAFLSFLPLSHAYEHTAGQFFPISIGAQIYYAEGIEALAQNLLEARPTIMTAVPRLYEVLREKTLRAINRQSAAKRLWFQRALALGQKKIADPASLTFQERILDLVCELLVRRKVRQRFGGRLKAFVSGGAPLNYEVGTFFQALGVRILQGYGQTEAAPVISVNIPERVQMETVGPPMKGVTVKIAEDGEICVRGELVMRGYWNNPEATAQTIDSDGWLHTGDIGELDANGFIKITDRKKDIIVNSGGDNISPQRVEGFLMLEPEIGQVMVYGDQRPHLVALVVPSTEFTEKWSKDNGVDDDLATLSENPALRKVIGDAIFRVNQSLSRIEKIRHFAIVPETFTTENGMMTPTLKIRRHIIRQKYGSVIEGLYKAE